MTSFCAETTATSGRSSSSSVSPSALSRLRCGARASPFFTASLLIGEPRFPSADGARPERCAPCRRCTREMRGGTGGLPSIFDARNGGSGAAYWRAPLHGGRPRAALRVQPSCSRVCSPPAAAGSHAPRSLGDGRRVLALSSHLLSLASIAWDGSPPRERTKTKQTGNALVGEALLDR